MHFNTRKMNAALIGAMMAGVLASCGSTPKDEKPDTSVIAGENGLVYEWWNNIGDLGRFAAVGSSISGANPTMARDSATINGRAQLAASLEAEIQSLSELWAQEAGDLANPESMSSMLNNETFTRQVVQTTLRGSVPTRYHKEGNVQYVLVVLEEPEVFIDNLVQQAEESIADAAYLETEVKKGQARDRMDELMNKRKAEYDADAAEREAKLEGR